MAATSLSDRIARKAGTRPGALHWQAVFPIATLGAVAAAIAARVDAPGEDL